MWKRVVIGAAVAAVLYGVMVWKLGAFTFPQHLARIYRTPEVQELQAAILQKLSDSKAAAQREVRARLAETERQGDGAAEQPAEP